MAKSAICSVPPYVYDRVFGGRRTAPRTREPVAQVM